MAHERNLGVLNGRGFRMAGGRPTLAGCWVVDWRVTQRVSLKPQWRFGAYADGPSARHRQKGLAFILGGKRFGRPYHRRPRLEYLDNLVVVAPVATSNCCRLSCGSHWRITR